MTVVDENGHNRGRPTKLQKRQRERRQIEDDKPPGHNPYLAPLVKRSGGSGVSWNAGQMRKRAVIAAIGDGKTLKEACKLAGVVEGTYYSWRETDKSFAAAANYARKNGAPQGVQKEAFVSFRKRFFGFDSYYHHLQIIEAIEQAEDMSVTLVLVPPYFGKTTTICDWLNYKIAEDPNVRVAYVSESEGFAKKQLGRIARRMTDTDIAKDYIAEYGPFKDEGRIGKAWSATHFTVAKADHDEADFTLETRGINSHVYGARFDIIIFDDIQSMNNLNQTETILEKIRQDFLSRPGRSGKVIFIGTRVNVGDVYERMIDEGIVDKIVQLPATNPVEVLCPKAQELCDLGHENCCGLHWADGTVVPHEDSMCKELWDNHALARRRRQVGNVTWLRSYQQRPQAAGSATFSEEMIESSKDALRLVGQHSAPLVALGLDPALGGQSALIACALYPDKMEVLDLQTDIGLGRVEQILFRVEQFVALYKPKVLVVETDTLQKGLARDERLRTMSSESGFLVHEHRTAGQKSDETIGVAMMASTFSLGEFRIPWGDAYAQRRMAVLVEELGAWRPQIATRALRQDSVMSAWFVWAYWVRMKQTLLGRENQFSRKGLETVWKRTAAAALSMKRKTA